MFLKNKLNVFLLSGLLLSGIASLPLKAMETVESEDVQPSFTTSLSAAAGESSAVDQGKRPPAIVTQDDSAAAEDATPVETPRTAIVKAFGGIIEGGRAVPNPDANSNSRMDSLRKDSKFF